MAVLKCLRCLIEFQDPATKRQVIEPAEFLYRGYGLCGRHVNTERGLPAVYGGAGGDAGQVGTAVLTWLAAIDNGLTKGSHMTGANHAFSLLCDQLGIVRSSLRFDPDWMRPG